MAKAHPQPRRVALLLKFLTCAALLAATATTVLAADAPPAVPASIGPFTVRDVAGRQQSQDAWRQHKAIVLYFIATECPVSNGYAPEMQRLADKYAAAGVACYGVHCDPATTATIATEHAKEFELRFPIWLDPAQTLARAAQVRVTPEAVITTPDGKVLYRGRIDDRYATNGKRRDEPTVRDLEQALEQVLAGQEPTVRETKAFGCPLPKIAPAALIDGAAGPRSPGSK